MDAMLSVAEGHLDPEDYHLDLTADAGVEEFDFKLDETLEDDGVEQPLADDAVEGEANGTGDFEIGYEEEEQVGQGEQDDSERKDADEEDGETSGETGGEPEYQDEIGYEDEEPAAANVSDGQEEAVIAGTEAVAGVGVTHEADEEDVNDGAEMPAADDAHHDEYSVFEERTEEQSVQTGFDDPETHMSGIDTGYDDVEATGSSVHPSHQSQGRTPASGDEAEDESGDVSNTPSTAPEITVHYNQEQYALIGAPSDDPDSYFFPEEESLDRSLSELLASIREVISDDISSDNDELTIRIDALDLEFGERSNEKFLSRSFQEIIACYSALAHGSSRSASYDPHSLDLELLIRRDSESRFLELLEEAGIVGELSHLPDHFDESADVTDKMGEDQEGTGFDEDEGQESFSEEEIAGDEPATGETQPNSAPAAADSEKQPEAWSATENPTADPAEPSGEAIYEEQYQELDFEFDGTGNLEDEQQEMGGIDLAGGISGDHSDGFGVDHDLGETELTFDINEQSMQGQDGSEWIEQASEQVEVDEGTTTGLESFSHGNASTSLHSSSRPPPSTYVPSHFHPGRHEDLIDYSDDDEPLSPAHKVGEKRRLSMSSEDCSPKRRKLEVTDSAVNASAIGDAGPGIESPSDRDPISAPPNIEPSLSHEESEAIDFEEEIDFDLEFEDDANVDAPQLPHTRSSSGPDTHGPGQASGTSTQENSLYFAERVDNVTLDFDGDAAQSAAYESNDAEPDITDTYPLEVEGESTALTQPLDDVAGDDFAGHPESASKHTSRTSTVNGDGIDFAGTAGNELPVPSEEIGQSSEPNGAQNDEIDWENDGDEPEPNAALTPSSNTGKRSRTDETESLSEEADHKRRRT
ncbi:hypothetical protein QBC47DRAFT_364144 [Echria macrotheca]|uniref:Uncharacterized protein n=1 Tax=Echria macrotheca TaxID=438768 RepID=A0AAJ0B503_9PEZI|nr:hypothetical protein QBC47DRAFT_364144 [Echria macrotheca]